MVNPNVKLSPHFMLNEFACHCGGKLPGCLYNPKPSQTLVDHLEVLRAKFYPRGLVIISGYRCLAYQRKVNPEVTDSQHTLGRAADIPPVVPLRILEPLGLFNGIGWDHSTGLVSHVDVRPTRVTPWRYDR